VDAISVLKNDHARVERLFKRFEGLGERAHTSKRRIVDDIIRELSVHASIEEQVFYPAVRDRVQKAEDVVLESLEEHHIVKWTLSELEKMAPTDERFDAKVTVLIESVREHVKEEEQELFPQVRKALKPVDLRELGERLENAKPAAPTRPHPRAPDEPPGNLVAGPAAMVFDMGKDVARGVFKVVRSRLPMTRRP
jgi:hemerythrin superfamily protein